MRDFNFGQAVKFCVTFWSLLAMLLFVGNAIVWQED